MSGVLLEHRARFGNRRLESARQAAMFVGYVLAVGSLADRGGPALGKSDLAAYVGLMLIYVPVLWLGSIISRATPFILGDLAKIITVGWREFGKSPAVRPRDPSALLATR